MTRTSETTITFNRPFTLLADPDTHPAGTYRVVTDEEELAGLSFLAYRRIATMLHLPAIDAPRGARSVVVVDPDDLAAAWAEDERASVQQVPAP